ncbi:MAG TPA: class I SAM-dependent methyltransferase [Myxococcales bacterium]|nr:class I SAM-dependent methyltransferase [Myxococcales bacterium]HIK85608.1 class I SAM-dependent methyltransferase [Myxococcales bacterium]
MDLVKMAHIDEALTTRGGDVCPVCGEVATARIELHEYRLFECMRCHSWSSDALYRNAETSFVPDNYFSNADSDLDKWDDLSRRLASPGHSNRAALDVGCGTGAYLAHLRERLGPECRLAGIELESDRVVQARSRNPDVEIFEGDARATLPELDGYFDLVTLWDVFEHVDSPAVLLKDLVDVLSEDGVIYIQTIHEQSILPSVGRLLYQWTGGRLRYPAARTHEAHHLVFFSRLGIDLLAAAAGLRVRDMWFDRLSRDRMDGSAIVTAVSSLVLALENAFGNGLFINLILERDPSRDTPSLR